MKNTEPNSNPKVYYVEIDDESDDQRLDNFLLARLKGVPKSKIYRIVRKGEVRVNKGRVQPAYRLKSGDVVRVPPVRVSEKEVPLVGNRLLETLQQRILYEDKHLMIINKPSGLAVHGGSGLNFGLIEALRQLRADQPQTLELVHRLDRDTSGCIMIAKKRSTLRAIHQQLREGGIDKTYLALVAGRWSPRKIMVDAPLEKNVLKSGERMVSVSPSGKKSKTAFAILRKFQGMTLVEAKPITGRTHQIRVHCRHAGHPIIGDDKYGDDEFDRAARKKGIKRLFLHASSLRLTLPADGREIVVTAPLDKELELALDNMDN